MAYAATQMNMTSGAAAYDLYGYSTAVRKPRPQQQPRQQAHVRTQPQRKTGVMNALYLMAALAGMILIIFSNAKLNEAANTVVSLENRLATLQEEQVLLRSTYEKSVDLAAIEEVATTQLGMSRPVSGQTVYLSLSGADRAEVLTQTHGGVFGDVARLVSEAFSNLGEYLS